jgi:hypothetical protein
MVETGGDWYTLELFILDRMSILPPYFGLLLSVTIILQQAN